MTTPFRRVRTGDRNLDSIQDAVEESLRPLQGSPLAGAVLIGPLTFVSGSDTKVAHGFGRKPSGFQAVTPQGPGHVWEVAAATPLFLTLRSDEDLTVSIIVF